MDGGMIGASCPCGGRKVEGTCSWPGYLCCRRHPGEWEANGVSNNACKGVMSACSSGSMLQSVPGSKQRINY